MQSQRIARSYVTIARSADSRLPMKDLSELIKALTQETHFIVLTPASDMQPSSVCNEFNPWRCFDLSWPEHDIFQSIGIPSGFDEQHVPASLPDYYSPIEGVFSFDNSIDAMAIGIYQDIETFPRLDRHRSYILHTKTPR